MTSKHSFTRKEIALLLNALDYMKLQSPEIKKAWSMSDAKLRQMYFKLYRIL